MEELLWMKQWNKTAILLKYIDEYDEKNIIVADEATHWTQKKFKWWNIDDFFYELSSKNELPLYWKDDYNEILL